MTVYKTKYKEQFDEDGRQKVIPFSNKNIVSNNNPLPIQDIDGSGRSSLNSIFGDKIIATRKPHISAQFQYQLASYEGDPEIVGTGTIVREDSMLKLRTGTDADGSASLKSNVFLRYIPGHQCYGLFTCYFNSNTNTKQEMGINDQQNGFLLCYNGVDLSLVKYRNGVETIYPIDKSVVFEGYDPTKLNVYHLSYGYLGAAPCSIEVMNPQGTFELLGKIEYPNSSTETHIAQTHLPLTAKCTNVGNTTNTELGIGSFEAGIVDGGFIQGSIGDPTARHFTKGEHKTAFVSGSIIAFRSKATYSSIENRISSLLKLISVSTEGAKPVSFILLKSPAFTGTPTWNDVSVDSVLEYSTDLVLDTGAEDGDAFLEWEMGKVDQFFRDIASQDLLLRPNDWAVFYCISSVATDIGLSIKWAELF